LSVVFRYESVASGKILSFAVEKGNGSQEARKATRKRLEDIRKLMRGGSGSIWLRRVGVGV
jgi:hypothetical protein